MLLCGDLRERSGWIIFHRPSLVSLVISPALDLT